MEAVQLDIFTATANRDAGMQTALEHANAVHEDWQEKAFQFVLNYVALASLSRTSFMTEDIRREAEAKGFPQPPHARAWGGIIARAAKGGFIQRVGIGPVSNVKAHRANATIWRAPLKNAA